MAPVNSVNEAPEVKSCREEPIVIYTNGKRQAATEAIIIEEPLSIRIEGSPYSLVMRSPGEEKAHVAGFCLSEGIIDGPDDIKAIGFCTESGVNVATVTLMPGRREKAADILDRKGFISQTSCGICGKEMAADIRQMVMPVETGIRVSARRILDCVDMLPEHQVLHRKTRSAHAAMLFDANLNSLSFAEDVGRHNALDKAVGNALLSNQLSLAAMGVMSSRLSYELVQKGARAGLALLIGISRPTALAVDLARSVRMTLGCTKNRKLMVFCHEERITI